MMHLPNRSITRHDFIEGDRPDDHVLVVVFLRGGADGLTLVPPIGDDAYHRARPVLAVRADDAIQHDGYFGVNPGLKPLMKYLERDELAIVHGAGSEDTTRSHFEAQDTMEHGGNQGSGWLGRFLRARGPTASALSAVAIGTTRPESLRGAPAGAVMQTLRDFSLGDADDALTEQLARLYAVELGTLGAAARDTIDAIHRLRAIRADDEAPAHGALYPGSNFGRGLREIARLIKADVGLAATTIDLPGWDTHFVQLNVINGLIRDLGEGIDAFLTDLGDDRRRVTVVAMTEFGRRLKENTSFGTDHGRGSVMFLLGSGVGATGLAGRVLTGWPDLSLAHLDEVGDVPAAINYRDVVAPLLEHHTPDIDLGRVFPGHVVRPIVS